MRTSQSGTGGYSQLVFDDSDGQARVALQRHASAHQGTDELNLGHLVHQTDNQRLQAAGFGAELKTEHATALRAGRGLLLSTYARNNVSGSQLDSREAQSQIEKSKELQITLAGTAQKHTARLKDEEGKDESTPEKLPAIEASERSIKVISVEAGGTAGEAPGGGAGRVTAYSEPHMQLSSPSGIVTSTPASVIVAAGSTSSISAAQDINFAAQGSSYYTVKGGISLFTYGKASNESKPNQEAGIKLHAASGKVSSQSHSGETRITADKAITVASITKSVSIAAKGHVMLTAQGAYIKLEGGNIMIHGPGKMEFKAIMKELTGPASSTTAFPQFPQSILNIKRKKGYRFSF